MIWVILGYAFFGAGADTGVYGIFGSILSIFPVVSTLPWGLDDTMVDFGMKLTAFSQDFWLIIPWIAALVVILGVYGIKMLVRFIFGSRAP